LKLEYFQGGGDATCVFSWQSPGGKKQVVPASVLFHAKGAENIPWDKTAFQRVRRRGGGSGGSPNDPWYKMDYGPFLSLTLVASFPHDNTTIKGIVVKLGESSAENNHGQSVSDPKEANVCFDTQLLRYAAGWTGGWLNLNNVAFNGAHGVNSTI